jgi:transcriptional regulator with XRE-family HTH domain
MAFENDDRRIGLVGLRRRLRVSGLELCTAVGVNNTVLSRWEHGHLRLSADTVDSIEDFLCDELAKLHSLEPWRHHKSAFSGEAGSSPQPRKRNQRYPGRTRKTCGTTAAITK